MRPMTDRIKEAKRSIEIAHLISRKAGGRNDPGRKEIRKWLETAKMEIDRELEEINQIDEYREKR